MVVAEARVGPAQHQLEPTHEDDLRRKHADLRQRKNDRLAGIVTERDLLRKVVAGKRDAASTTVSDVMTRDVVALGLDDDLEEALALVHARHIRHLPVVADGQVVGLVTSGDLTRWAVRDRTVQLDILMESGQREFPL